MAAERADKLVHQARFLEAYANCADISLAAKWAQIKRGTHYGWMETDPEYPAKFKTAQRKSVDVFRNEAVRRCIRGTDKPVFYKGRIVGYVKEFSDTLLLAYLKARDPDFKDSLALSNPDGSPLFSLDALRAYVQQGEDHKP